MAIPDLLWACPQCGKDRGLERTGNKVYACSGCGTRFERARGAGIRASTRDGRTVVREAREWVDRLPAVLDLLDGAGDGPVRSARVLASRMTETDVVRGREGYLNRIEIFGEPEHGTIELARDTLVYRPDAGGEPLRWPLERLTAVQASSRTLQIKARDAALVSFRFPEDSVFLWELLLQEALVELYRRSKRREILEFQPRILTRPTPRETDT